MLRSFTQDELTRARQALTEVGFCEIENAFRTRALDHLQSEAIDQYDNSYHASYKAARADELQYEADIADFGVEASAYHLDAGLHALLRELTGRQFTLRPEKSCFTYYTEGCFLGVHRDDIDGPSPISVISYFWSSGPVEAVGLKLDLHADGNRPTPSPISSIPTRVASILVGFGTRVWHGRPMLGPNEKVIASTGSFFACA